MPLIGIYCDEEINYLSSAAARDLGASDRIRSIWPLLVRTVLQFHSRLRGRRRINYDPEDILSHLYLLLLERDRDWDPDRGLYFSFAYRCVSHELEHIRERASTVQAVHNARNRAAGYEEDRAAGRLTDTKARTLERLQQAMSLGTTEHREEHDLRTVESAAAAAERADHEDAILQEVRRALARLPRAQAMVLAQYYGFASSINRSINGSNGNGHTSGPGITEMATACGCSTREFQTRLTAALDLIRRRLRATVVLTEAERTELAAAPNPDDLMD